MSSKSKKLKCRRSWRCRIISRKSMNWRRRQKWIESTIRLPMIPGLAFSWKCLELDEELASIWKTVALYQKSPRIYHRRTDAIIFAWSIYNIWFKIIETMIKITRLSQLFLTTIITCLLLPVSPTMFCFIKTTPNSPKQASINAIS